MKDALAITVLNLLLVIASGSNGFLATCGSTEAAAVPLAYAISESPIQDVAATLACVQSSETQHLVATDCKRVTVVNPSIEGALSAWEIEVPMLDRSTRGFHPRSEPTGRSTQHFVLRI